MSEPSTDERVLTQADFDRAADAAEKAIELGNTLAVMLRVRGLAAHPVQDEALPCHQGVRGCEVLTEHYHPDEKYARGARPAVDVEGIARAAVIDAAHLARQREWSSETFGPGTRLLGVLDHIRKEVTEIEADPSDLGEWVDVLILAFDGAWRAGHEPQAIIDAIKTKQARNEARTWPDWRTADPNKAIEHLAGEGRDR